MFNQSVRFINHFNKNFVKSQNQKLNVSIITFSFLPETLLLCKFLFLFELSAYFPVSIRYGRRLKKKGFEWGREGKYVIGRKCKWMNRWHWTILRCWWDKIKLRGQRFSTLTNKIFHTSGYYTVPLLFRFFFCSLQ